MKRRIFCLVLLATLPLTAFAQVKTKATDKPVTVTLVRWPYT